MPIRKISAMSDGRSTSDEIVVLKLVKTLSTKLDLSVPSEARFCRRAMLEGEKYMLLAQTLRLRRLMIVMQYTDVLVYSLQSGQRR